MLADCMRSDLPAFVLLCTRSDVVVVSIIIYFVCVRSDHMRSRNRVADHASVYRTLKSKKKLRFGRKEKKQKGRRI